MHVVCSASPTSAGVQVDSALGPLVVLDLQRLEIQPSKGSLPRQWENHVIAQPFLSTCYVLALYVPR